MILPQTPEWETEPEFEALQACCVKGGAGERTLPRYIRSLLSSQKQAIWEMVEGMKMVSTEQELKIKNGALYEVGENKVVTPTEWVKGFNKALSDVQERIRRI